MGAASQIYVFDYRRYLSCVVPSFRRLLEAGEFDPWLAELWRLRQSRYAPRVRRPFVLDPRPASVRTRYHLRGDLATSGTPEVACVLPVPDDRDSLANLQDLFEFAVKRYCLGEARGVGNNERAPLVLQAFLEAAGLPFDDTSPLGELCDELDTSAGLWTHSSGSFGEGIHGWLTPAQTEEFAEALAALPLPPPDLTRSQIGAQARGGWAELERLENGSRLARMRQIAELAARSGQGILWGNDIYWQDTDPPPAAIDPAWLHRDDASALKLAEAIRAGSRYDELPILADALEDAGCDCAEILTHLRRGGHAECCWAVDRVLGVAEG